MAPAQVGEGLQERPTFTKIVFTEVFVRADGTTWTRDVATHLHQDDVKCGEPDTWEQAKLRDLGLVTPAAGESANNNE